ncbi:uncharacterized protein [Centroberyx affinis]|uniref:uncharacterized protein isoform X2 n=1 Tax=Centroberyx affinis TaxID=166261 RepID=UPI003A5C3044
MFLLVKVETTGNTESEPLPVSPNLLQPVDPPLPDLLHRSMSHMRLIRSPSPTLSSQRRPNKKTTRAVKQEASMTSNRALLLQVLAEVPPVELKKFQWCLTQDVLQDFLPIPPRWLRSADAWSTCETMVRCYGEEGAVRMTAEILRKMGRTHWIGELLSRCPRTAVPPMTNPNPQPSPYFVKTLRKKLINRIQHSRAILDALQEQGLLSEAEREAVSIYANRKDKNRALVDLVLRKGTKAQEMFYQTLSQLEPFLLKDLDSHPTIPKLLEGLVSDELRSFQWLVSQQAGEGCPPIGQKKLEHADWLETQNLLEKLYGPEQAALITLDILPRIVPLQSLGLQSEAPPSTSESETRPEPDADTTPIEITPEVHEEGNMYRLQCPQAGVFRCSLTGLVLEGDGDVTYRTVPWDRKFLEAKGWIPAGPLFKFTCLRGSFHRLHLPHCQVFSDGGRDFLSVAHVTEDRVDFVRPERTTDKHVVIGITGFSAFGLVRENEPAAAGGPINGLVLLFHQPSVDPELYSSLYVLLLPRNVVIPQVVREWKKRPGVEYIEALPDCELIPNQTYKLFGKPVKLIQPEEAKFLNFEDYHNYIASFEVHLERDVKTVQLELKDSKVCLPWLAGWLFPSQGFLVWSRVIQLKASPPADIIAEKLEMTDLLLNTLSSLRSEDFGSFQRHLGQLPDPVPVCALEAADRMSTVDKMVQKYLACGAADVTVEILRKMKFNDLADDLQRSAAS